MRQPLHAIEFALRQAMVLHNAVVNLPNGDVTFAVPIKLVRRALKEVRVLRGWKDRAADFVDWRRGVSTSLRNGTIERLEFEGNRYLRPSWSPTAMKAN